MDSEVNATFYVDGQEMGSYQPDDAEELGKGIFQVRLEVWSPQQDGIRAHFDDVRIGWLQ